MKKSELKTGMSVELHAAAELVKSFASTSEIAEGERPTLAGKLACDKGLIENIYPGNDLFDFRSNASGSVVRIPVTSIMNANGETVEETAETETKELGAAADSSTEIKTEVKKTELELQLEASLEVADLALEKANEKNALLTNKVSELEKQVIDLKKICEDQDKVNVDLKAEIETLQSQLPK